MTNRPLICRCNLDGGVGLTGGRAANQKRGFKAAPLHFLCIENHLVQGRRNQPTQADDIRLIFFGGFQNTITVHHHTEIDHLVAIATKHHTDDVLTNVVHISFHGGDHEGAGAGIFAIGFLRLHKRREIGHGLFHDARAFYHLRQEHLAGTEKFANNFHAVHQRPFDHLQWSRSSSTSFLGVFLNKLRDAVDQRVAQARSHIFLPPFLVGGSLFLFNTLELFCVIDQPIRRVRPAIEQHVLHVLEQFLIDLLVHLQHAGIHDAHVQTGVYRVV